MNRSQKLFFAIALAAALGACKKPDGATSAAGDAGASAAGSNEPCEKYRKALCEQAGGETSPTCGAIGTATGIMPAAACNAGLADLPFSKAKLADARKVCDDLIGKLCKDIDNEPQTCGMLTEQTKTFPPERCKSMMDNYAQVLAQVKKMAEGNKPLDAEKMAKIAGSEAPAFGPADAKVTIVEFSDFQCPYCVRAADAVKEVKKKYSDRVRFVFRQFPLSFHQNAGPAAQASLAANAQGKFWEYHDTLFANQSALSGPDLEKYAQKVGLKMALFKKAMTDKTYEKQVQDDMKLGELVAVSGTPTMFLNGKRVGNSTSAEAIGKMIEDELKAN